MKAGRQAVANDALPPAGVVESFLLGPVERVVVEVVSVTAKPFTYTFSKTLVKEIPKSEKILLAKAKKHRDAVLKAAREMMEEDPDLADYLKGLI